MKVGALGTFDDIILDVGSACASVCRFGVRLRVHEKLKIRTHKTI